MGSDSISLADALEFVVDNRGKTVPTSETGIPLIATNCVSNDNLYPEHINVRYVSSDIYDNWFRAHPKPNDILLTNKGSKNGAICLVPDPVNFCIAQDMVALRADESIIDPAYLFSALRSPYIQNQIKQLNVDSVIPHFKKTDFNKLYIPLPAKKIQKRIGEIYLTLSEKIELNRQLNETLESMAKALFKSWFVDFDPVMDNALAAGNPIPDVFVERAEQRKVLKSSGGSFKYSDNSHLSLFPNEFEYLDGMGWVPLGWGVESLDNVCSNITDGSHTSPKSTDEGYPMSSVKDMNNWGISLDSCRRISEDDFQKLVKNNCKPLKNDVLIAKDGSYLKHIFVVEEDIDLVILSSIAILRPNQRINPHFLSFTLKRKDVLKRMENYVSGAVIQRIVLRDFRKFEIVVPPYDLQEYWYSLIGSGIEQCWKNNHASVSLSKLRDVLLPKLLSGELRIPDAEKLIDEVNA